MLQRISLTLAFVTTSAPWLLAQSSPVPIFLIQASDCAGTHPSRALTGFRLSGVPGIVTALHCVVGCKNIQAQPESGPLLADSLELRRIEIDSDLAVLDSTELEQKYPSGYVAASGLPAADQTLSVYGFPSGLLKVLRTTVQVRRPPLVPLSNLLSQDLTGALGTRGSPVSVLQVISIQGTILHGHSGSPLFLNDGTVAGVAEGGLMDGTVGISWAIPIEMVRLARPFDPRNPRLLALIQTDSAILFDLPAPPNVTESSRTLLINAAQMDDVATLNRILAVKPPQSDKDEALSRAVEYNHATAAQVLLRAGARASNQLICLATDANAAEVVRLLAGYSTSLNPNAVCNGDAPPLLQAVNKWERHLEDTRDVVGALLSFPGIDPNLQDRSGSVLLYLVEIGDENLERQLLTRKDLRLNTSDEDGYTAADIACLKKQFSVLQLLLDKGAKGIKYNDKQLRKCAKVGNPYY